MSLRVKVEFFMAILQLHSLQIHSSTIFFSNVILSLLPPNRTTELMKRCESMVTIRKVAWQTAFTYSANLSRYHRITWNLTSYPSPYHLVSQFLNHVHTHCPPLRFLPTSFGRHQPLDAQEWGELKHLVPEIQYYRLSPASLILGE